MKQFYLFIFLVYSLHSFSQDFLWATKVNKTQSETTFLKSICTDNLGNVYGVGTFTDGSDFGIDTNNSSILTNSNVNGNGYLLKLDGNKNFVWVKQLPGLPTSVIIDSQGNVIVSGISTNSTIDLNPDPNLEQIVNNPTNNGGSYIIKLNNAGNLVFGDFYFGINSKTISTDLNNNIIITGSLSTSQSLNNVLFVKKINPQGNFIWQKNITGNNIHPHSIITNNNNEIFLKGNFFQDMTFNNINYSSSTYNDFIFKLNENGDAIWYIKLFNTTSGLNSSEDKSIGIDQDNNVYFLCNFVSNSTSNFTNTNLNLNSYFGSDCGIFKIDTYGNLIWHRQIIGDDQQKGFSIDVNNNTNTIGIILYINRFTYLDDTSNLIFPTSTNQYSSGLTIFFNNVGEYLNLLKTVNLSLNHASRLISTNNNEYFIGGTFGGLLDFDPSSNIYTMHSSYYDGFILKLGNCDTTTPLGDPNQVFCSSENPSISDLNPNSSIIKWYNSPTSSLPLQDSEPLINGQTYYAAKQVGNCQESNRLEVTVTINSSPISPLIQNQTFCQNDNATLSSLNVVGQNLVWYDSHLNIIPNTTLISNNEIYYVTQNSNGCESDKTTFIGVITSVPLPIVDLAQQFCIQDNATIASIPITGQNITWYDAASNGTVLPASTVLQDGETYYATQTVNGCESETIPVTVTIQNTAAPTGNNNQSFCSTANATLNEIVLAGTAITWYDSLNGNVILPNNTPLADGTTYYATQTVNGCESTLRLAVTISLINTLNATNYSESLCDAQNDGHEVLNLANYNTYLIGSAGNTFRYYTSENAAENEMSQEEIISFSNYNLTIGSQIIYVRIDSPNTCYQIVELELTLYSNPILNITDIMPICEGSSITITAGNGYNSYLWSTNETTPSIVVSQPGSYSVTVTENHGTLVCTTSKDFTVVQSNIGSISEIISSDWTDTENTITVLLSGSSTGDYEYSLDGIHYQESNVFNGLQSGLYTVYINDRNGCGEVKETVFLLMYPKFFTPNGDGYNDFWKIQFSENEPHLRVQIFDRYGKFIKELGSNTQGWDGTYLGKMLPSTDYWFTVTRENAKVYKGHFSLKR